MCLKFFLIWRWTLKERQRTTWRLGDIPLFYQIGGNVSGSLNLLYIWVLKKRSSIIISILSMYMSFILKGMVRVESPNSGVYVKRSISNEIEVDYQCEVRKVDWIAIS